MDHLCAWIAKDEGLNLHPGKDVHNTIVIGYGRNLNTQGITLEEAYYLLQNDVKRIQSSLFNTIDDYHYMPTCVQEALINMAYQLGINGLLQFKRMLEYLHNNDYENAANAALESQWARETPQRAKEVTDAIRKGNQA